MRERGILFQGPMVQAIQREVDPKTQTRRAVNWRGLEPGLNLQFSGLQVERSGSNWVLTSLTRTSYAYRSVPQPCPYGLPGDRLWVRERWMPDPPDDGTWPYTAWAGCREGQIAAVPERFQHPAFCHYAADWLHGPVRWTPGIHMPRWASRITLEITSVRVERLQAISEADALAEGIQAMRCPDCHLAGYGLPGWGHDQVNPTAREAYRYLWDSINSARLGMSWADNPWVWAVSFKRVGR